jgi:HPt (histidine-containing phosphotransfer) domain-containing protein
MNNDDVSDTLRDLDEALRIAGGSRELVDELFAQFCAELPACMAAISELTAAGAHDQMREELHQLKGGAVVCAVKPFIEAVDDVHRAVKTGQYGQVEALLAILQARAKALVDSSDG